MGRRRRRENESRESEPPSLLWSPHSRLPTRDYFGRGGFLSMMYTIDGVANVAPLLPADDAGKTSAVITLPASVLPPMGSAFAAGFPASPRGAATAAITGVV